MLKNYWLIAIRKLLKHKVHAVINILGLTIGVASCLIIFLLTRYELSYDRFHPGGDRIYRVVVGSGYKGEKHTMGGIASPMPPALRKELTGCESVAGFYNYFAKVTIPGKEPKQFDAPTAGTASPLVVAEPQYFDVFNYRWLAGNPATSLNDPFRVVLSAREVNQYFGPISPDQAIGREVIYDDSLHTFVSGVVQDWDRPTDFGFRDFISFSTIQHSFLSGVIRMQWGGFTDIAQGFVKLGPGSTPARVERQFPAFVNKYLQLGRTDFVIRLSLQPLTDIHFNAAYADAYSRKAHLPTLYGLMGIAVFILLLAVINFVNLSTAQSLQRTREVGIRKVLGGRRRDIVLQFLGETFLLTLLAVALSLVITPSVIALLHNWLPPGLLLDFSASTLLFLAGITIATALLAGWFPAKFISALLPVLSLKGQATRGLTPNRWLHRGLIVFQFTISLVFIIGTVIVARQLHYIMNKDLGFDKDAILTLRARGNYPAQDRLILAQKLRALPGVAIVSLHTQTPEANFHGGTSFTFHGAPDRLVMASSEECDTNYLRLFGIRLIAGRNFFQYDSVHEYVINETCARELGFLQPRDALGQPVETGFSDSRGTIVGVVKDFHTKSLHEAIKPFFLDYESGSERTISIRLGGGARQPDAIAAFLKQLQRLWHATYPNEKFSYSFFDETIANLYQQEQKTSGLLRLAMSIAICISCMGLLGLATFAAEQRSKEISIRKVLGASIRRIFTLLTIDFLWPVALAIVIASPIAWYFMQAWLRDFVYRTTIPWWLFGLSGLSAIAIALLTVGFQAIRAATANPVDSLRSE